MNGPNENLLVGWKEIAAYLKCSVRKVQRLENIGLPVNRIPGAKSVWASKADLDDWLARQARKAKEDESKWMAPSGGRRVSQLVGGARLFLIAICSGLSIWSSIASLYGLAVLSFGVTAGLVLLAYPGLPDNRWTRAAVSLFLIAGMAYTTIATTLPDVVRSIANMTTLRPALTYPVMAGLRFIPIPLLICLYWIANGLTRSADSMRRFPSARTYLVLGLLFLVMTGVSNLALSDSVWQSGLPIRWTLLAGEVFVLALNAAMLWLSYGFFSATRATTLRQSLCWCGTAYLLIALTAATLNRHWNDINRYHLDVRRPMVYRVQNRNAIADLRDWLQHHVSEAGPDLVKLSNDPEFMDALANREFYKLRFDERFQFSRKAIVLGYQTADNSGGREPAFRLIRFPAELAYTLGFR